MAEEHERPRWQPLDSIATKLILFVFGSTLATALVVSGIAIQSAWDSQSRRVDQLLPAEASQAQEQLTTWLEIRSDALRELAAAGEPRGADDLERARNAAGHFAGLTLVGRDGEVLETVGQPLLASPARTIADGPGLRALPAADGSHRVALSLPTDAGSADAGWLIAILPHAEIRDLVAGIPTAAGTSALLVDGVGHVLFGPGSPEATIALGDLVADDARAVSEYTNYAGTAVIASARRIPRSDFIVVVEVPFEVVFAPAVSVVKRILVADVCIISIFSFLAYAITTSILRPIEILSDGARRIAGGQLQHEIPEPETQDEIGLLTRIFNEMMRELRRNQTEIESANAALLEKNLQLQQANEVLEQLSITDGLTKLHNHRFFQDHLTREIRRVDRVNEPLSMILIDIDDFKSLNDRLGHAAGDELLRRIAVSMNASIRETDLLARYGGDEFVILTSNTDLAGARRVAEKVRTSVAESSFIIDESLRPTRTTLSMGAAQYRGTRKGFFSAADQALYRAKAQGKNCVVIEDEDA